MDRSDGSVDVFSIQNEKYNELMRTVSEIESRSSDIDISELDEIGKDLAKAYKVITDFTDIEKATIFENLSSKMVDVPLIGGVFKDISTNSRNKRIEESGIEEILQKMFVAFEVKQKKLYELMDIREESNKLTKKTIENLESFIEENNKIISSENEFTASQKMQSVEQTNRAMRQVLLAKDSLMKGETLMTLITRVSSKISDTLPTMEANLNRDLRLVGAVKSLTDSLEMFKFVEDLTNKVHDATSDTLQKALLESNKVLIEMNDTSRIKRANENMVSFNKQLISSDKAYQESVANSFKLVTEYSKELSKIDLNTTKSIENHSRKALNYPKLSKKGL